MATKASEFHRIVVTPSLRDQTARRLLETEEFERRKAIETDESESRLTQYNDEMLLVMCARLRTVHRPALRSEDEWERRTRTAFESAEIAHIEAAATTYSPCGTYWMPHDTLRELHTEWTTFFKKWKKSASTAASSLLSSFFCGMLVDETLEEIDAIRLSRYIMESCLEVANDWEADATDAVPYHTFLALVRSFAGELFPAKHPYIAVHLMSVVLSDRVHRTH